ncbi:MAG: hypothetical protein K6U09_10005 [Acidobacteriia bacterium]|jgi:hypothetical protein|nr:hypothetical protein [Terriglobia bacterium]
MLAVAELLQRAELLGVRFWFEGDKLKVGLPDDPEAEAAVDELRVHRDDVLRLLQERETIPPMPPGVRLVEWKPKPAPVMITRWAVVIDVPAFVRSTLHQLEHALAWEADDENRRWLAGHRSSRELQDYLSQVGCVVEIEEAGCRVGS